MKAEIISIGTEILLGQILNTNQQWLSRQLAALGIDVYYHSTVGDNPQRLIQAIRQGLERSDIVITTGGLGPTVDDITLEAIARALSKKLIFNQSVLKQIRVHFGRQCIRMPRENVRQAHIPEGAIILKNEVGTAPGFIVEEDLKIFIALPGPPRELNPMFEHCTVPYLKKKIRSPFIIKTRTINITGLPESVVDSKVKDILHSPPPVTVGIFSHPSLIELKVTAKAKNEKEAKALIDKIDKKISARLKDYIFGRDDETLEEVVGRLLTRSRKTLAIAESCTGGLISSRITDVPGSSKYFKRGGIAYSDEVKVSTLKVPPQLLKRYGAVSQQVATQMAKNIREIVGTDYGLGVTGIAGPSGGTRSKPVGLVYIAVSGLKKTICRKFNFTGERKIIKFKTSQAALDLLRRSILQMPETVRTFIAIELNEGIHSELASLQSLLKRSNADVKWMQPESIHLTLKFFGNIDARKINEIEKILNETAASAEPFVLTLKGIGAFPKLDYPQVIWVGVENGAVQSQQLAKMLEEKLEKIGIPREGREFHPHLTLGRVKSLKNKDNLKEIIEATKFEPGSTVDVNHLTLFKSELTREGSIYTPLFIARMKNA